MRYHLVQRFKVVIVGLVALTMSAAYGQSDPLARVSFDEGAALVRGVEDSNWGHATTNTIILSGDALWVRDRGTAEIEIAGGTYLRMADGSNVEMLSVAPPGAVRFLAGSIYVQRLNRTRGYMTVRTPSCVVAVDPDSCARIDVLNDNSTTVSVRRGAASVRAEPWEPQRVRAKQRVYVDPGYLPSEPVYFDTNNEDDFDAWNRARAEFVVAGADRIPRSVPISGSTIGYGALGYYGDWLDIQGRTYWCPTNVPNYVPYRHGHWSYVTNSGNCWVDDYPFGYVTSHYGRWSYYPQYGWVWNYDPVWSPAWVATLRCGPDYVWSPVDYHNRPVMVNAAATFEIGGVSFSLAASTFVPQDHAYVGASYVKPISPAIVQNINVTNVSIWNINADARAPLVSVPYKSKNIAVYNYSPQSVVRGPEKLARNELAAADAVARLKKSHGSRELKVAMNSGKGSSFARTDHGGGKSAKRQTRSVRLDADQKQSKPKLARDVPTDRRAAPSTAQGEELKNPISPSNKVRNESPERAERQDTTDTKGRLRQTPRTVPNEQSTRDQVKPRGKDTPKPDRTTDKYRQTPASAKEKSTIEENAKPPRKPDTANDPSSTQVNPKSNPIRDATREPIDDVPRKSNAARTKHENPASRAHEQGNPNREQATIPTPQPDAKKNPRTGIERRNESAPKPGADHDRGIGKEGPAPVHETLRGDGNEKTKGNGPPQSGSKKGR